MRSVQLPSRPSFENHYGVPPSDRLEGIDLRPHGFKKGCVYDVDPRLAQVLTVWEYVEVPDRRGQTLLDRRRTNHAAEDREVYLSQRLLVCFCARTPTTPPAR